TSLVYHLAWMYADHSLKVLVADLDPQANLTSMFLDEDRLVSLWSDDGAPRTIHDCLRPLMSRTGDILVPVVEQLRPELGLIPGHLALSRFEDLLSENWPKCLDGQEAAFRVLTAFHRIIMAGAREMAADLVLIDVGPNLGAINRSALIAAEQVVLPLAPDLFSLQGMRNLGPTLREWRKGWKKRMDELPDGAAIEMPSGEMRPSGYVVMQHSVRESRPVKAYQSWVDRVPLVYRESVLGESVTRIDDGTGFDATGRPIPKPADDPCMLALLKHYRSLMPMAMDAHKPMFHLKPADGAIGSHIDAVRACYQDFKVLAGRIAANAGLAFDGAGPR
ncbi:MAG: ParA family protein, partial [Leptothrix sp. (in: b-proteobacteria)]